MRTEEHQELKDVEADAREHQVDEPLPSAGYRQRAWREFQRALDPLARPKRLRPPRP